MKLLESVTFFFEEMGKYVDEQLLQVNETLLDQEMYLLLAISIEILKMDIAKRVPEYASAK